MEAAAEEAEEEVAPQLRPPQAAAVEGAVEAVEGPRPHPPEEVAPRPPLVPPHLSLRLRLRPRRWPARVGSATMTAASTKITSS